VAHTNEITKWNEIAVSTVNSPLQPATISSPNAAARTGRSTFLS
jgi:hypothetical protein